MIHKRLCGAYARDFTETLEQTNGNGLVKLRMGGCMRRNKTWG